MATYYIDNLRGLDANNGTSQNTPWKNLSKLATTTLNSGDSVLLARDSYWEITSAVNMSTVTGTKQSPVTIDCYSPTSDTSSLPTIKFGFNITSAQWTYDAPNNGWYYTYTYDIGAMSNVLLGNTYGFRQEAALPLTTFDYAWYNGTSNKIYVYAPASTDPTTYYGSVYVGPQFRGAFYFGNTGTYVNISNIRGVNGAAPIGLYGYDGTRTFNLNNIVCDNCSPLVFVSETAFGGVFQGQITNSSFKNSISAQIHLTQVGNSTGGINTFLIKGNKFSSGNYGYPQGLIYLQAKNIRVENNTLTDAKYGSPLHLNDGCAIYAEVGARNCIIQRNIITDCFLALQDNSGRSITWNNNIIKDCYSAMKCTDESAVGTSQHYFYNNTCIGLNNNKVTKYKGNGLTSYGWYAYSDTITFSIRNNIFIGTNNSVTAILTPLAPSNSSITNNLIYTYTNTSKNYQGGTASPVESGTITTNPLLKSDFILSSSSPAKDAGVYLGNMVDYLETLMKNPPSIGACETLLTRGTR